MSQEKPDYQAVLKDLEDRRAKIDAMIAFVRGVILGEAVDLTGLGSSSNGTQSVPAIGDGKIPTDAFFGMSVNDAIKKLLEMRKRPMGVAEIQRSLEESGITTMSKNFYTTVYTALDRGEGEDFAKIKRQWGLAKWYGGRVAKRTDRAKPAAADQEEEGKED